MDDLTTVEWLSTAIGQATRSAKFCVVGCLPVVDPGIEVDSLGTVTLPLKRTTAKELIASCHLAPFGKGLQTLVDKTVRNTLELDPKKFCLSDAWNSSVGERSHCQGADEVATLVSVRAADSIRGPYHGAM
jgi:hypothetical protein